METIEKAYKLRDLEARDIFTIVRILGKIDFKEVRELWTARDAAAFKVAKADLTNEEREVMAEEEGGVLAMNLIALLVNNLPNCENELYGFTGSMIGKSPKDMAKMDPCEFMDVIIDIVSMEKFADFFKRASALIN